jgi:undecaprenyl diphosphate synthase
MQSTSTSIHVGVIMDGNGRWAVRRGLPRSAGHHAGVDAIRRVVEAAPGLGIGTLSLFAFSADNWARPAEEVQVLMALFGRFLRDEAGPLRTHDVRLSVIGRRDRLPPEVVSAIAAAEALTARGTRLHLRVAIDYSSRDAILEAARLGRRDATRERFTIRLGEIHGAPAPDVDLLIRTGGERRLSDFLLWESAYAELFFTARMWPDFHGDDLATAVAEFRGRDRRFGALPETASR